MGTKMYRQNIFEVTLIKTLLFKERVAKINCFIHSMECYETFIKNKIPVCERLPEHCYREKCHQRQTQHDCICVFLINKFGSQCVYTNVCICVCICKHVCVCVRVYIPTDA